MMFREIPGGAIAIAQPSHAWLSGQLMRAWGNAAFGTVRPFEAVCLGAEQHDIGWLEWEQAPSFNPATGRPHSFRELTVAERIVIWRRGPALALAFGRYPALLVSLHGTGLYAKFAGPAEDLALVRQFLSGQEEVQRRLTASLRMDRSLGHLCDAHAIERNRCLVRTADRLSIAICTAMQDLVVRSEDPHRGVVRQVPTADGETDLALHMIDGNSATISVAPWPFAASSVEVACEGIVLPASRWADPAAMQAALRDATRIVVSAVLQPA